MSYNFLLAEIAIKEILRLKKNEYLIFYNYFNFIQITKLKKYYKINFLFWTDSGVSSHFIDLYNYIHNCSSGKFGKKKIFYLLRRLIFFDEFEFIKNHNNLNFLFNKFHLKNDLKFRTI
jgi:hypothetical protein